MQAPADFLDSLCHGAMERGASDLFLHEGMPPQLRVNGRLVMQAVPPVAAEDLARLWARCGAGAETTDFDASLVSADGQRFRVNLFQSLNGRGAVLRPIKTVIPPLETLGLPVKLLVPWITARAGLILVTGPTGSGKSTTLASCLDWLNHNHDRHIVTIEDPIEYLFTPDKSLVTQREVGTDTPSFAEGLRRSLRQSPDVILLGEIRDATSAFTALQAAETGHLVFATLHAANVLDSLERLARLFDASEREGVLQVLSQQLIGVLSQKLVPALAGGRAAVVEHFENQGATRRWILDAKFRELADFIGRGDNPANVNFLRSLVALLREQRLSLETALEVAPNPQELKRLLRGVNADTSGR